MKARKLTLSKMAARFLWMRLLSHQYSTAELRTIGPALDELEKLRAFDRRIITRLTEAGNDESARLAASEEIDAWEETWAEVSVLLTPESYDLAKERWLQIPKINDQGRQTGLEEAKFAPQQRKVVLEISNAFDKAAEVAVAEKEEPCPT